MIHRDLHSRVLSPPLRHGRTRQGPLAWAASLTLPRAGIVDGDARCLSGLPEYEPNPTTFERSLDRGQIGADRCALSGLERAQRGKPPQTSIGKRPRGSVTKALLTALRQASEPLTVREVSVRAMQALAERAAQPACRGVGSNHRILRFRGRDQHLDSGLLPEKRLGIERRSFQVLESLGGSGGRANRVSQSFFSCDGETGIPIGQKDGARNSDKRA